MLTLLFSVNPHPEFITLLHAKLGNRWSPIQTDVKSLSFPLKSNGVLNLANAMSLLSVDESQLGLMTISSIWILLSSGSAIACKIF